MSAQLRKITSTPSPTVRSPPKKKSRDDGRTAYKENGGGLWESYPGENAVKDYIYNRNHAGYAVKEFQAKSLERCNQNRALFDPKFDARKELIQCGGCDTLFQFGSVTICNGCGCDYCPMCSSVWTNDDTHDWVCTNCSAKKPLRKKVVPKKVGSVDGKPKKEPTNGWPHCNHDGCDLSCKHEGKADPKTDLPCDGDCGSPSSANSSTSANVKSFINDLESSPSRVCNNIVDYLNKSYDDFMLEATEIAANKVLRGEKVAKKSLRYIEDHHKRNEEEAIVPWLRREKPKPWCVHCTEDPCVMLQYANEFGQFCDSLMDDDSVSNQNRRYKLHRFLVCLWKGPLPKGHRIRLPACIIREVRDSFPSPTGEYTGHKEPSLMLTL